jgi:hypothetical protein
MYTNTDSTTYATCTTTRATTSAYRVYIRGFNFDAVPQGAHVIGYTIKVKGYETGLSTKASYAPRLADGTRLFPGDTIASSTFDTSTKTITVPSDIDWDTLVGCGSNFGIRVTIGRAASGTQGYLYIYGAEIEVTYSYLPQGLGFRIKNNGTWVEPQKIYAKSEGTWHLAKSLYINFNGWWIPGSVDPTGHSIVLDDFPYDENNPDNPYNDDWADSFYESADMNTYLHGVALHSDNAIYTYAGPMEYDNMILFLWESTSSNPEVPPYVLTETNNINLLTNWSISGHSDDYTASILSGGSALGKVMLLNNDRRGYGTDEAVTKFIADNSIGSVALIRVI